MSVLAVTGAFAAHTTRLYNYYIVEAEDLADQRVEEIQFVAVNYLNQLQYLGRVIRHERWQFDEAARAIHPPRGHNWPGEVMVDLREFACKLQGEEHYIFLLEPIHGGCCPPRFRYRGDGPFIRPRRYFDSIEELFGHYGDSE